MIENPFPESWQNLQAGVCRILNEIGLNAETGKIVETPRGRVELDVFAIDEKSVDKIKYIVECKNWNQSIPQSVVHAFTTIMHEVGANIGFIISKKGLQQGAESYTQNTNIVGLTYEQFQRRYFGVWYERYFVRNIGDAVDSLTQYVEPFNSYRDRIIDNLPDGKKIQFSELMEKYRIFGMTMAFFEFPRYSDHFALTTPDSIESIKKIIYDSLGGSINLQAIYFRDFLNEIVDLVQKVTYEFNAVFGEDIFVKRHIAH